FTERARRTVWHSLQDGLEIQTPPGIQVTSRKSSDWKMQKRWLNELYPPDVRWNMPLNAVILRPGLLMGLLRLLSEQSFQQWSAYKNGKWIGSLSWQTSYAMADWLWLAAPPEARRQAVAALLPHAIRDLRAAKKTAINRTMSVNFPAGDSADAFEAAGFEHHQTLIWMSKSLR
ncbi:MAG TPA: hypothetical protein VJ965_11855, partial [Anaerolineales bacterium]|nr:hypothetical protein [Anaerolineales bacterium]